MLWKLSKTFVLVLTITFFGTACKSKTITPPPAEPVWVISEESAWYDLYNRLKEDGIYGKDVDHYFSQLEGKFSQVPMGAKVTELYKIKNRPKTPTKKPSTPAPKPKPNPTGVPGPWYKGFVVDANAEKCKEFIKTYSATFQKLEETYNIPAEVVSALIYIETKHGTFLGQHNALINLASMSTSTKVEQIPDYIQKLTLAKQQNAWILSKMKEKSDWAYGELKSLLLYARENQIDPLGLPSSIYGALGYGQFMPSNIPKFAVDGDSDGIINLFHAPDGIMSVGNYLSKTGWNKQNFTLEQKIKILLRYNYSRTYAKTILALSVLTKKAIETEKALEAKKGLEASSANKV